MSKTTENLKAAFSGEAQARNKYLYFAKVARKEGYHYIARIFEETADHELQHAKEEFKLLGGISNTEENLKSAIEGENYEYSDMYPAFAKEAEEEGNTEAAKLFREIAKAEVYHEKRFKKLLEYVQNNTAHSSTEEITWKCSKCGYNHTGTQPPEVCPSCKHPKEYYEPECLCFNDEE
ncbi:MAG: rubrerythrin family protein [Nanobdellota archaeon]